MVCASKAHLTRKLASLAPFFQHDIQFGKTRFITSNSLATFDQRFDSRRLEPYFPYPPHMFDLFSQSQRGIDEMLLEGKMDYPRTGDGKAAIEEQERGMPLSTEKK